MTEIDRRYRKLTEKLEKDPQYWVEQMRFDFVEEVERLMQERGINRAELARRLEASPAYVTQMLKALFNPTLLTLTKVALALDATVSLHLSPAEARAARGPRSRRVSEPAFTAADKSARAKSGRPKRARK